MNVGWWCVVLVVGVCVGVCGWGWVCVCVLGVWGVRVCGTVGVGVWCKCDMCGV